MDHLDHNLLVGELGQALLHRLHGTLYVRLDDDGQFLDVAGLDLAKQIVQGQLRLGIFDQLVLALGDEGLGKASGLLLVLRSHKHLSGVGHVVKAQNLHRCGRSCLLHPASPVVHHGANLAVAGARRDGVAHMQGALLHQHSGNRTLALIQLGLDHQAAALAVGVRFQLHHIRGQQHHLKQIGDAFFSMCRNRYKYCAAAPILGNQFVFGQLLFYFIYIGAGLIDLVDGNNDLNSGCLGVVDGLHGLRHHAVVRRNHQNRDIRGLGAAHTHCGKRLVSGRIQKCDLAVVDLDHGRADMLGDSARFPGGHVGLADGVEQGGFTVIYVTHYAHNRRSGAHVLSALILLFEQFGNHVNFYFLLTQDVELHGDLLGLFVVDFLV